MRLKTESGVSITIIEEGSSKILLFNKSVRAIELGKDEISQISALLTQQRSAKTYTTITKSTKPENCQKAAYEGC